MSAIERCRTAALGGHVARCQDCAYTTIIWHSSVVHPQSRTAWDTNRGFPCRYLIHSPLRRKETGANLTIVGSAGSRHISPRSAAERDWITKKNLERDAFYRTAPLGNLNCRAGHFLEMREIQLSRGIFPGGARHHGFVSVTPIWFAETVLHSPTILAPVKRLKSRSIGAIEPAASTIAIAISISVTRAVVVPVARAVIAVATRPITAQVQIDSLRKCRCRHADNRGGESNSLYE